MALPAARGHRGWPWWAGVCGVALVGGLVGGLIVDAVRPSGNSASLSSCAVPGVANDVLPTVVTISASQAQSGGTGSGEVIRSDGYILTNNHVVAVAANGGAVEVTFSDGESLPATIVGRDPATDLAVLHVTGRKAPKVISLGSSTSLKVGQPVVALGAPLGLSSTVTTGIVSALGRTIQVPAEGDQLALLVDAVQTDAAINPGNSGGALVDCSGRLVGVPTAGATAPSPSGQPSAGNIGIGFAIPVNLATLVADEIITTGSVSHAYFGFQAVPISPALAARTGVTEGLFVSQVAAGGPADNAGLQAGDVISAIDGQPARSVDQLVALTLTKRAGDKVALTYRRQGRSATTTVTLATQP